MLSHTCGLYLVSPVGLANGALALDRFGELLAEALDSGPVEAFLLRTAGGEGRLDEATLQRQIEALLGPLHARGVPLVLEQRVDLVAKLGCDGVHLRADRREVQAVRRTLGETAIIGAAAGSSRHAAMEAADAGADYVTFGLFDPEPRPPEETLLAWWQELMEPPAVAMGGITLENARRLAEAGADFLALRNAVWNHEEGPAAALDAFRALLR
jgi:thiamine-phosphate pyrophosphorylase